MLGSSGCQAVIQSARTPAPALPRASDGPRGSPVLRGSGVLLPDSMTASCVRGSYANVLR